LIQQYEKQCELQVLEQNNIGAFYRRLKSHGSVGPVCDDSGQFISNSHAKTDKFNKYFASVNIIDNSIIPETVKTPIINNILDTVKFTPDCVASIIRRLKITLLYDPDNLPSLFFKQMADSIAAPLTTLYYQLMSVGAVPNQWKTAVIVPVFKSGIATSVSNYRPISLICIACKIMEKIIVDQMTDHLMQNGVLNRAQHGFLKGLSTCSNLLKAFNDWTLSLNERHGVTVAYIDFAKAFDTG